MGSNVRRGGTKGLQPPSLTPMISGSYAPPQPTSTSISTHSGITKIRCTMPQQVLFDKNLVNEVQDLIQQRLESTSTPVKSVNVTKSAPHGIKIKLPVKGSVPDWIEPYFTNLNFLIEQLGISPSAAIGFAGMHAEDALRFSRLAQGLTPDDNDCWALCQYAAHLIHREQVEPALELLKRLPEAERIKNCVQAFECMGHPINRSSLSSCADEQTVFELVHMVAVALYVTSRDPNASDYTVGRLQATADRLKAQPLTPQEVQALDAKYGSLSVTSTSPSGHVKGAGVDSSSSSE